MFWFHFATLIHGYNLFFYYSARAYDDDSIVFFSSTVGMWLDVHSQV